MNVLCIRLRQPLHFLERPSSRLRANLAAFTAHVAHTTMRTLLVSKITLKNTVKKRDVVTQLTLVLTNFLFNAESNIIYALRSETTGSSRLNGFRRLPILRHVLPAPARLPRTMTRKIVLQPNEPRDIVFHPQTHQFFGDLLHAAVCSVTLEIDSSQSLPTREEIAAYIDVQDEHVVEQLILRDLIKPSKQKIRWAMESENAGAAVDWLFKFKLCVPPLAIEFLCPNCNSNIFLQYSNPSKAPRINNNQAILPSTPMTEFSEIFRGQYAVFSRMVPQAYLHDYGQISRLPQTHSLILSVAMGGLIATTQDELERVTFCVCNDRFDTKFISMWVTFLLPELIHHQKREVIVTVCIPLQTRTIIKIQGRPK
ncbi:hypothetical protein B0H14DRAFT_3141280 [Mycena olivaceomarginata]|nr:hypothetical protein B0H14DRAFT_3141280 [Mycena olivaceomarginata]